MHGISDKAQLLLQKESLRKRNNGRHCCLMCLGKCLRLLPAWVGREGGGGDCVPAVRPQHTWLS